MKNLVLSAFLLALVGCGLVLESRPLPYACDHVGDGGVQCTGRWSCSYVDRCFDRDAGLPASDWRCTRADHCPTDWQCGVEIASQRFCQQLGVGAPAPCRLAGDCQGGWRCGADGKCFDPAIPDGGAERDCHDAGSECPNGFRCGEYVAGAQHCLELSDAGFASPCSTDLGCEGGWRCDTGKSRCVKVTDVVGSGNVAAIDAVVLSPLQRLPMPLLLAMTRVFQVPFEAFAEAQWSDPRNVRPAVPGTLIAALYDGGVLLTAQSREEEFQSLDGSPRQLYLRWLPLPPGATSVSVLDLVVSERGPLVRFDDGGVSLLSFDGGASTLPGGPFRLLRQLDSFEEGHPQGAVVVSGVLGDTIQMFPGPVVHAESEVIDVVGLRDDLYAVTRTGVFAWGGDGGSGAGDGGPRTLWSGSNSFRSLSISAGKGLQNDRLGFQLLVTRGGGVPGVVPFLPEGMGDQLDSSQTGDDDACPPGSAPLQLAYAYDTQRGRASALVRCRQVGDGGTFPVAIQYEVQGSSAHNRLAARVATAVEDPLPFREPFTVQRGSAFVRAHAGTEGRVWHAVDGDDSQGALALLGNQPLRSVLLDRQPDTIVSLKLDVNVETVALVDGVLFKTDERVGFVSNFSSTRNLVPLGLVSNRPDWLITTTGVFSVGGGQPTKFAGLPTGSTFAAPVAGVSKDLLIDGVTRSVLLVSSRDTIWAADVTDASASIYATPATLEAALVPTPGIRVRSLALEETGVTLLSGFLTTNTTTFQFQTTDLVRWLLGPVSAPSTASLPIEVWTEASHGRVGTADGVVWSLPIMVALTGALPADAGTAVDYGRKCGELFVTSRSGLFHAVPVDGGQPGWQPVSAVNRVLDGFDALRLYETHGAGDQLRVVTKRGQVIDVAPGLTCDAGL